MREETDSGTVSAEKKEKLVHDSSIIQTRTTGPLASSAISTESAIMRMMSDGSKGQEIRACIPQIADHACKEFSASTIYLNFPVEKEMLIVNMDFPMSISGTGVLNDFLCLNKDVLTKAIRGK